MSSNRRPSALGRFVKSKRTALRVSQEDLAKAADVSAPTISRLESGETQSVGSSACFRMLGALEVSDDEWLALRHYPEHRAVGR